MKHRYFDLLNGAVVEYRPDQSTHDPSQEQLQIAETALADGVRVETIFDGKAYIDKQGVIMTTHPDGWMSVPPLHFWTLTWNDYGIEFLEGYETLEEARQGHADHVRRVRNDMGFPQDCHNVTVHPTSSFPRKRESR